MHAQLFLLQAPAANPNAIFANLAVPFAIFAIFYFIVFRPQQKQRRALEQQMRGIKRGDEIVTLGGRILRAETAAISVAAILQHRFGDFN